MIFSPFSKIVLVCGKCVALLTAFAREKNKELEMAANVVLLSDDCAVQCVDFPSLGVGGGQEQV